MSFGLAQFVVDFARGISSADAKQPIAVNQRSGTLFRPGIGPHTESKTVELVLSEMRTKRRDQYSRYQINSPYPEAPRQACDLAIGEGGSAWFVEFKMLRLMGDNGKPNDNILTHILSPYRQHRSALTDCEKLAASGFGGRKAVVIFGYEYPGWPLEPVIQAFETLARQRVALGPRHVEQFSGLCHPVHQAGAVYGWEVRTKDSVP